VALLVGLLGIVPLGVGPAGAQQDCPIDNPLCNLPTTTEDATTTTEDVTTTTEETTTTQEETETTRSSNTTREVVTTTTMTVTTLNDVLVPGDGTEGSESTTTTARAIASGSDGISDDTLILLMVSGLAMVALLVGVLTWRYWSATRPVVGRDPGPPREPSGRSVFLD
jgi:hypothetical protein